MKAGKWGKWQVLTGFLGHMSKARRQVQGNLKFVDFVTVLVDAFALVSPN